MSCGSRRRVDRSGHWSSSSHTSTLKSRVARLTKKRPATEEKELVPIWSPLIRYGFGRSILSCSPPARKKVPIAQLRTLLVQIDDASLKVLILFDGIHGTATRPNTLWVREISTKSARQSTALPNRILPARPRNRNRAASPRTDRMREAPNGQGSARATSTGYCNETRICLPTSAMTSNESWPHTRRPSPTRPSRRNAAP